MLLYHLWTIGAHSVQGSTQRPFSLLRDSNPDSVNANMVYQRLNDVGHPDPPVINDRSLRDRSLNKVCNMLGKVGGSGCRMAAGGLSEILLCVTIFSKASIEKVGKVGKDFPTFI